MSHTISTTTVDTSSITISNGAVNTVTAAGPYYGAIAMSLLTDELLDKYEFNKLTVDHKVTAFDMLKLKDSVPTYADEIKENLAKNASREVVKKMTFTKKHEIDTDVHHFIGRVWVFTESELKQLIEEVRHA